MKATQAQLLESGGSKGKFKRRNARERDTGRVPSEASTKFREAVSKNQVEMNGRIYDLAKREDQLAVLEGLTAEGDYSLADAVEVSQGEPDYEDLIEVVGEVIRTLKPEIYDDLESGDDPVKEFFYHAGERALQFEMLKDKLESDKPLSKADMAFLKEQVESTLISKSELKPFQTDVDKYVAHKLYQKLGDQGFRLFKPLVESATQKTMNTAMGSYKYFDFSSKQREFTQQLEHVTTLSPTGIDTIVQFLMHSDDPSAMLKEFDQSLPAEPMKGVPIETPEQQLNAISSLSMIQNPVASMCSYLEGIAINKGFYLPPRSTSKKRRLQQLTKLLTLKFSKDAQETTQLIKIKHELEALPDLGPRIDALETKAKKVGHLFVSKSFEQKFPLTPQQRIDYLLNTVEDGPSKISIMDEEKLNFIEAQVNKNLFSSPPLPPPE